MVLSQRRERLLKRLTKSKSRARAGLVLVEGLRAAAEAVDAGAEVSFVVVSRRFVSTRGGALLAERFASDSGAHEAADVVEVDDDVFGTLAATENPQGVLLVCEEPTWSVADLPPAGHVLVLDAVQDPGNVGTLVRSAAAFGFRAVLALDGTGDPWGAKAVRASAGAVFRIPVGRLRAEEATRALRDAGWRILVAAAGLEEASGHDGVSGSAQEAGGVVKVALVVGNEGDGVRAELREGDVGTVSVGMSGLVESLNVGVAGSILMHEMTRGRV